MGRKIAIIDGHPDPGSGRFCRALIDAYMTGAQEAGCEIKRVNVAQLDFPILRTQAEFVGGATDPGIVSAQQTIKWADHILIVFPLWLGTAPALLKVFFEQVFRPDFAFDETSDKLPKGLLKGRSARIVVTMGMPGFIYRWFYRAHGLKNIKRNILKFSGISPVHTTIFGMVEAASDAKRAGWLGTMKALGRQGA